MYKQKILIRLFIAVVFFISSNNAFGQNGLECIVVEKYYISNAADSAGSVGALPSGSVTYRFYADMLPGYEFQAAYGVPGHAILFTTSTAFFNNEDRGATTPTFTKTQARGNSIMLDSWLSVGGACSNAFGILKAEDNVANGGATVINNTVPPILQNNDVAAGIPLTTQDGIYTVTAVNPPSVTFVGLGTAELDVFDAVSNVNDTFITSNGSWACLSGAVGPVASTNKVLIAQITTNGVLHYELNVQIRNISTGNSENYVARNPVSAEILLPCMMGTLGSSNSLPSVNITSPANGASYVIGNNVVINASATDADGTVASVEFFVDGVSVGVDNTAPYSANYTAANGSHTLTAVATDNNNGQTTSSGITINVSNNPPPVVSITAPANGSSYIINDLVSITATATDDGSVTSVQFFVDGISISTDNSSPYTASFNITTGSHIITAVATDNLSAQTTSAQVMVSAGNNIPPSINITSPVSGDLFVFPAVVNITADASDVDGTISQVQFYVNGVLVGSDATAPYVFNWTSVIGSANITARATDDLGGFTISSGVLISIADPNIPYKIVTSSNTCASGTICIPITAIGAVNDVIGYDIVMNYDKNRVQPTGNVTIFNNLINPSYVDEVDSIDNVNGKYYLSLFFNTSAPINAEFNGTGDLLCVEFSKLGGFQPSDTAAFSISLLKESYFTGVSNKSVDPGKYITYKDSSFAGVLKFWSNNAGLGYDASNPSQFLVTNVFGIDNSCVIKSLSASQPDVSGNFSYNMDNGSHIVIERDIAGNTSVQPLINGFDAMLVSKAVLKDPSFVPSIYQAIAMDVNLDGIVSAGDISQINQRAVLMIPEFRQAWNYNSQGVSNGSLSKDWIFVDSSRVVSNPSYHISSTFPISNGVGYSADLVPVVPFCLAVPVTNPNTCPVIGSEKYVGVMLGDINGNFATVGSGGNFRTVSSGTILFDLSHANIHDGYADIPVYANSAEAVHSLDLAINFDENHMAFESITDPAGYINELAYLHQTDRTLRITSNSRGNYPVNFPSAIIRFQTDKNSISEEDFTSVVGYLNGDKAETIMKMKINEMIDEGYSVNVFPNPASDKVNVIVTDNADIQLLDLQGRLAYYGRVQEYENKTINVSDLPSGLYMLKVINENFVATRLVVVAR